MSSKHPAPLPSKAEILAFIQDSPGKVGKRELARAFNLDAEQRPWLRQVIKELEEDGSIQRGHKRRFARPGALPEVTVLTITGTDREGELLARPLTWPLDGEEEAAGPPPRIFVHPVRHGQPAVGVGDRVLARLARLPRETIDTYEARVIKRLGAEAARVLGVLDAGVNGLLLRPTDKKDRQDYVIARGDTLGAEPGALVEAELLPGRRYGLRHARVVEIVGRMEDPRAVSLIAIHQQGIPVEFSPGALDQAEACAAAPMGRRVDLRPIPLVTIDGADARDFDDAVWAEADGAGWHLLVAIADVAHYVTPDSPLDQDAFDRGNSVYFPDRVVPMLPEALSNGWCSLRPAEDRPCLAVHIWIDAEGNKTRHQFVRAMMRSAARLTYEQVQAALDGQPDDAAGMLLEPVIQPLHGAFKALRAARDRRGALDIEIPERKVVLDATGAVVAVVPRPSLDAHKLIEEFMVCANVCAAEELERLRQPCMYRVHDEPALDRVEALREFLKSLDLNLATGAIRPQNFNHVLAKVKDTPHEHLVNTVVLRSQAQAVYSPENRGHFGLGLRRYAHFTSPIRRYADLLVHRALIRGLGLGADGLPPEAGEQFEAIGEHISQTERRAATAEREAIDRFTAQFLHAKVGADFSGRITGVNRFGLFVELDDSGASGLIPVSTLAQDYYLLEEDTHSLVGRASGDRHRLGDAVVVRLREADATTGGMILELLENTSQAPGRNRPGGSPGRGPMGGRGKGGLRPGKGSIRAVRKGARPRR